MHLVRRWQNAASPCRGQLHAGLHELTVGCYRGAWAAGRVPSGALQGGNTSIGERHLLRAYGEWGSGKPREYPPLVMRELCSGLHAAGAGRFN